jgi:hypothetical protein
MPQSALNSFVNTAIPIILIIIAVGWIWWKFGEPLKKLGGLIIGLFSSGKNRAVQSYQSTKEIVYDI